MMDRTKRMSDERDHPGSQSFGPSRYVEIDRVVLAKLQNALADETIALCAARAEIDRLRSELSTRPLPEGAVGRITDAEIDAAIAKAKTLATYSGPALAAVITRLYASLRAAEERASEYEQSRNDFIADNKRLIEEKMEARAERDRAREALDELAEAAFVDMTHNQGTDDDAGGWWSLRTANAIAKAREIVRALTAPADGKE